MNDINYESYVHDDESFTALPRFSAPPNRGDDAPPFHGGAGAILFSSLVYQGWKFPAFLLTDSDERYLFDLEVS
jgi:hypothetical protein